MRKKIVITLFLCFSSVIAFAQTNNSEANIGSVYSRFGVGIPTDFGSSNSDGLGLSGVSYNEPLVANISNPALWGSTVYGMGTGGLGIDNFNAKDNAGSASNSLVYLSDFQLQLPLYKDKLGISASFSPVTRSAFRVKKTGQQFLDAGSAGNVLNYETTTIGSGGISRYELGVGWKISPYISLGYAASIFHASIDNDFTTDFDNDHPSYANVTTTLQTSASGFGNRFGGFFTVPHLAGKNDPLQIGLVVRLPVNLNGDRVQQSTYVSGDPNDKNSDVERKLASGDIHLPLGLTAGLTYKASRRVAISTEGRYEKWSSFSDDLDQPTTGISFADRLKAGAGMSYYPFLSGSDKFLSHFKYRFGASYDSGYLNINGQKIQTLMFSAGLGILSPSKISGFNSSVDISFHYGIRGTKNQNLAKESVWGVKLSLNLAELFFFRPKLK